MKFRFLPPSQISGRMYCTIPLFPLSVWCERCVAARHYAVICKQLLNANGINRVRWVVLGLLQDGACTGFFENLGKNSFKGDLSNATTFNPPLFSLVDTFKAHFIKNECHVLVIKNISIFPANVIPLKKSEHFSFYTNMRLSNTSSNNRMSYVLSSSAK
jgi:hypothetical protein